MFSLGLSSSHFFQTRKRFVVFVSITLTVITAGALYGILEARSGDCVRALEGSNETIGHLSRISKDELERHDGIQEPTLYIGLDCLVYDVTSAEDSYYGEGRSYHYLVGRDASDDLHIFGGAIIQRKYPVVGIIGE